MEKWENLWLTPTNGSITKEFLPSVKERVKLKHFKLNFKLTKYLTEQISKHIFTDSN